VGTSSIVANKIQENLIIKVMDDGLGEASRLGTGNGERTGIGLKNIDRRLRECMAIQPESN
jgi:LytS/YehU family sensor histidine kinase